MRTATPESYNARIERVLCFIADHVNEPLSLEQLASAASLSPYHFHRIWRAMMGEPIIETVRRLKMELAAHRLATTEAPVTQIALASGFSSSQTFARAFRKQYGKTPSDARADGAGHPRPLQSRSAASIEIVSLEPFAIVATRHVGPYDTRDLKKAFRVVFDWAVARDLLSHVRGIYGVPLDDERYDAGFDFGPCTSVPDHLRIVRLGGSEAARLRVHGSYDGLDAAYDTLYGVWLPQSGREPGAGPLFNHYHNDPDTTPEPDLVTDVFLPVV